jgi:ADP-heptose:LPS heptosyltransferase
LDADAISGYVFFVGTPSNREHKKMSGVTDLLILRGGGLGDTLLAVPAVHELRRRFSPCRIEWIGNPAFLPILRLGIRIERLRSADGLEPSVLRQNNAEPKDILDLFSRKKPFDLVVAWTPGDESFDENLKALGRKVLRTDPHPPKDLPHVHATDYLLQSLKPLGIETPVGERGTPEILVNAEAVEAARNWLGVVEMDARSPYYVLHPGSGGRWKCWPPSCFVRLAEILATEGDVCWLTGPADVGVLEEIETATRVGRLKSVTSPPLPALAGLLRGACGFVGNDSGVTHLAAACGAPTVALFGPTDPAVWGPRGERVIVFKKNAGCRSCRKGDQTGHTCLAAIPVEEVAEAVLGFDPV